MMATSSREVNRLRTDIHAWHTSLRFRAPLLAKHIVGSVFDDPGILDTFSDLNRSDQLAPLGMLLDRAPSDPEAAEWFSVVSSCKGPAACKRSRTMHALDDPFWRALPPSSSKSVEELVIADLRVALTAKQQIASGGKWVVPSVRRKKHSLENMPERRYWIKKALEMVLVAGLPNSQRMADDGLPERVLHRLVGGRRLGTIRTAVRIMTKLSSWCHSNLKVSFPPDWTVVSLYLDELSRIPCGPSVPKTIVRALGFFEELGGVKDSEQLAKNVSLLSTVRDLRVELVSNKPPRVKRKAPQLPLAVIAALEVAVVNADLPTFQRLLDWSKLVRHWGCLRWSDLLFAPPELAKWTLDGLTLTLTRTKTTGPGKKVEIMYAYISSGAFLIHSDWLEIGWLLLKETGGAVPGRTYLVPLPDRSLDGFSQHEPKFEDAILLDRKSGSMLPAMRATKVGDRVHYDRLCDGDGELILLFEPLAQLFWRLHGVRAGLVNWLCVLEYPKDVRSLVGRWSPSGSDEYLRTQKAVTFRVQNELAARIRSGQPLRFLGEGDMWEEFAKWADSINMPVANRDWQIKKLRFAFTDFVKVPREVSPDVLSELALSDAEQLEGDSKEAGGHRFLPCTGIVAADFVDSDSDDGFGNQWTKWLTPGGLNLDTDSDRADDDYGTNPAGIEKGTFLVSLDTSGRRRTLHQVGRCWRKPGLHFQKFEILGGTETLEQINIDKYSSICKDCFPEGNRCARGELPTDSSSDDSSSSGSEEILGSVEVQTDVEDFARLGSV